jgi:hypothetical protein
MAGAWLAMPQAVAANGRDHIVTGNLVRNPSFEDVQISATTGYIRLPGWTVSPSDVAEIHRGFGGVEAYDGGQWIELDYLSNDSISQDLLTVPGQFYRISFAYANRPGQSSSTIDLYWDDVRIARLSRNLTSFTISPLYRVEAKSRSSRLTLAAAGASNGAGDWVDMVTVVPEYGMVLPQFADGGGWKTLITYTNPTARTQTVRARIFGSGGNVESLSHSITLGPNESRTWESPGNSGLVKAGWVSINADAYVSVSSRFRQALPGQPVLEAAVPVRVPAGRMVADFNNSGGFSTGIAISNPSTATITVNFLFRDESGVVRSSKQVALLPNNHSAFFLGSEFPELQGMKGSLEVTTANPFHEFAAIGLLFTPSGTFTTLPY